MLLFIHNHCERGVYIEEQTTQNAIICPFGASGDRLWVRETFLTRANGVNVIYRADTDPIEAAGISGMYGGWKPSIHMPRWASRITRDIINVRVERLRDISEEDAIAEGIDVFADGIGWSVPNEKGKLGGWNRSPIGAFCDLWQSVNGKDSWDSNPWVWVIEWKPYTSPKL